MNKEKKIVVIGGGTGTYTVLIGLKKYPVDLTAVVSMADDGGSTKTLREEFGVLPPGSVRPALIALSNAPQAIANLFQFRFEDGDNGLSGHNLGNIFLTALAKQSGSFEKAIEKAEEILNTKGHVIPSTLQDCNLVAKLENGKIVKGEAAIDEPKHDGNLRVEKVWLEPKGKCKANPKALKAIREATLIVIGPGDLFTSILPNLLTTGFVGAVQKSKAKKVYVCNLMTKFGETNGYTALNFVDKLEEYLGKGILDYVLVNTKKPGIARIRKYEKEHAEFVKYNKNDFAEKPYQVITKSLLRKEGFVRHDSAALARVLISLL
ncbi:uridine diphosphate-N-acetylglucosamine-binding protein YvcK [Patescibacteria group bacterium]|nr:uridine diphosphate-N-acetylglucosamine-binding protein YvcK [Patescibacteria group bacterium]